MKLDWTKLGTQLGLKGSTANALAAFKKRNDDARRKVQILSEQPQSVDFSHYRQILRNQGVIEEIERAFKDFKPAKYDVDRQIKAIEAFEQQALKSAEETKGVVDRELKELDKTLKNIEEARPFEQLTVVRITPGIPPLGCALDCGRGISYGCLLIKFTCRMRLPLPVQTSTSAPLSLCQRVAGKYLATR